jgi:hypothetical protein
MLTRKSYILKTQASITSTPLLTDYLNWGGTYFKTFSSTDLVNWTDEGVILDLPS